MIEMGVKGLTTFMNNAPHLFENHRLQNTRIIIDGSNISYHISKYVCDIKHGGSYTVYAQVRSFASNKLVFFITIYFINTNNYFYHQ